MFGLIFDRDEDPRTRDEEIALSGRVVPVAVRSVTVTRAPRAVSRAFAARGKAGRRDADLLF